MDFMPFFADNASPDFGSFVDKFFLPELYLENGELRVQLSYCTDFHAYDLVSLTLCLDNATL
jgi:hypothetical protein